MIDNQAAETQISVEPGLTSVNILDYTLTNHINFEADIHFPEAPGIVQVETFGCAITAAGSCFYGMQVEAIMDRIKDNISLDHLSRLLVDVHIDSSQIIDSVLSPYQRALLDLIFTGDASNRDKVNLIIANEITPHLTAEEYMDKGEYENELKQVLGDTRAAFDISEHDTLIFGEHGLLIAGPNSRHHEPLLCAYLEFESMNIFTQNYFARTFVVVDDMKTIRALIEQYEKDPNRLLEIRTRLSALSKEIIQLEETLGYLRESIADAEVPPEPPEQAGRSLYDRLQIGEMKEQIERRVDDLHKNIAGARLEMEVLTDMTRTANETKAYNQAEEIRINTRTSADRLQDDGLAHGIGMIIFLTSGLLALLLLDKLTGSFTFNLAGSTFMTDLFSSAVTSNAGVWMAISLIFWVACGAACLKWLRRLHYFSQGNVEIRMTRKEAVDLKALEAFVRTRDIVVRK